MVIKKKRINSLSCLSHVEEGKNLVMALRDATRFKNVLLKLGFSENLTEGERILPSMLNPTMKNRDHDLSGDWAGHRECHILPDWLLVYRIEDDVLVLTLARTGTHSDLFGK